MRTAGRDSNSRARGRQVNLGTVFRLALLAHLASSCARTNRSDVLLFFLAAIGNAEFLHAGIERARFHVETFGRAVPAFDTPVSCLEGFQDVLTFGFGECDRLRLTRWRIAKKRQF